jgi:Uncharacterized conserved protein (DUF2278)
MSVRQLARAWDGLEMHVGKAIRHPHIPRGIRIRALAEQGNARSFETHMRLPNGWHHLESTSTSGALDYARSPLFVLPLGCLSLFWGFIGAVFQTRLSAWNDVTGDEAGNALVAMIENSSTVFAFGAPYTTGNGVDDVHCNQGDPPGSFQSLDDIWQDGCVVARMGDGSLSAYLGKFSTQTLNTTDAGLPK